jgi:hypothetical protein
MALVTCPGVVDGGDGEEGGTEVADLGEEAVQMRLVGDGAAEGGGAVVGVGQG